MNRYDIGAVLASNESAFDFAVTQKLISMKPPFCVVCNREMKFITSVQSHGVAGMWKCSGEKCGRKTRSLFFGTIFSKTKLDVSTFIKLIYEFSVGFQGKEAVDNLDVSAPTIIGFFKEFRKMMSDFLEKNRRLVGGPNMHVEMDETHMFKRKYNVGRVPVPFPGGSSGESAERRARSSPFLSGAARRRP